MPPLKAHLSPRDLALTIAIVALWGFSFVPIKIGLREIPPFALAALRFFFAAVPLVFFIRRPQMPWRFVVAYGFAIGVCQFGLLFLGMKLGMPAGLSSLVIQVQVFFTIGLGIVYLGDRVSAQNLAGAVIATAGVVLLAAYKLIGGATATLVGFVLVLVAALAWGVGNVVAKRAAGDHEPDMFALVVWSSLVPPLPLAAAVVSVRRRSRVVGCGRPRECARVGLRGVPGLGRDAVRLRVVGGPDAPLPDRTDLAVRAADSGVGTRQRRAVPRRIAGGDADRRRAARASRDWP